MGSLAPAARFALVALGWSLGLFGLFRLPWIEARVVQGLIDTQQTIAHWYGATPTGLVLVNASCSGADVIALCLAVTLAYPVSWPRRLVGAAGAVLLMLTLNTARIGSLITLNPREPLFNTLHLYIWPSVIVLAAAAYVLVWSRIVDKNSSPSAIGRSDVGSGSLRFGLAAIALLLLHGAAAPWTFTSTSVLEAAVWTAGASERVLSTLGVAASAQDNFVFTPRGVFQVTQECLLTPVLPLYLAALLTVPLSTRRRLLGGALVLPLFFALGVLRVLVLALPPAIASAPLFLAHGFFQIVVGTALVATASLWDQERRAWSGVTVRALARFAGASLAAVVVVTIAGGAWRDGIMAAAGVVRTLLPHTLSTWLPPDDLQGAMLLLPGYQVALLLGLSLSLTPAPRAMRALTAVAMLAGSQVLLLVALGELSAHTGITIHALVPRALAVAVPVGLVWWLFRHADEARSTDDGYRRFWQGVGREFPDLSGAASTHFYFANEARLLSEHLAPLADRRLLKSDLWDEAKNTHILQWAADQGAVVFGIDISDPIVRQARRAFDGRRLGASVADVRALPFPDASFDAIYSMGTVEHFDESEAAVREMARVLRPGGRLVLGVPNRHDPFLRPLLVAALFRLGWYDYGFEKSYSRRALRTMLERAGLDVVAETGILFVPGWLRMADLLCHVRGWRRLERLTAAGVRLFAMLDRRFPRLRRHGYLLASVATRR
jgi:exosortase/archaeosortase family protein